MPARIELLDLIYRYDSGEAAVEALRGVSLVVEPGEFVAVMGPSGCGKTTLLNLAGGMDRPTEGRILVNGEAINEFSDARLTEYRRNQVGFIFQFFNLLSTLTVLENVELPLLLSGQDGEFVSNRARDLLAEVGMSERLNHYPHQLSGGEMQRVAIARALSHRPQLILADEPTGNLDTANGQRVLELLRDLSQKHQASVLMATHSREAASYASRTVFLLDGRIMDSAE